MGQIEQDLARFCEIGPDRARFGQIAPDLDQIKPDLARLGQLKPNFVRCGQFGLGPETSTEGRQILSFLGFHFGNSKGPGPGPIVTRRGPARAHGPGPGNPGPMGPTNSKFVIN